MTGMHRECRTIAAPRTIGFETENNSWPLDFLISLPPATLQRIAVRTVESVGQADTLDFLVTVPARLISPGISEKTNVIRDIVHLFESLDKAFGGQGNSKRLVVAPDSSWLQRLVQYQLAQCGPEHKVLEFSQHQEMIDRISRMEIPVIQRPPEGILSLLADFWPEIQDDPAFSPTFENYLTYAEIGELLVTSSSVIHDAWSEMHSSPIAGRLPPDWEIQLGKNWLLIPENLRTLSLPLPGRDKPIPVAALLVILAPFLSLFS